MHINRPNQPIDVVVSTDPALDEVSYTDMAKYFNSRNLDDLPMDKLSAKPTIYHCKPLQTKYEDFAEEPTAMQRWMIFATHCDRVSNPWPGLAENFEKTKTHGETVLADGLREIIPRSVVKEVVDVIIQAADCDGVTLPFAQPDTSWQGGRMRRAVHLVTSVSTDTASE